MGYISYFWFDDDNKTKYIYSLNNMLYICMSHIHIFYTLLMVINNTSVFLFYTQTSPYVSSKVCLAMQKTIL